MAKKIRAIKCPQCGSSRVKELRPDYYECRSCGTEFFLDSDDINIHHHHHNAPQSQSDTYSQVNPKAKVFVGLALIVALFLFIWVLPRFLGRTPTSILSSSKTRWHTNAIAFPFVQADGTALVMILGDQFKGSYSSENRTPTFVVFDPLKGEKKSGGAVAGISKIEEVEFRYFRDGSLYALINEAHIYRIDPEAAILTPLDANTLKIHTDLSSGIAIAKFDYDAEGFKITTNDGKERIYMPASDKVYTKEEFGETKDIMPPNGEKRIGFDFSHKSRSYPEEPIQLIRYEYMYQPGYPSDDPYFKWGDDFDYNTLQRRKVFGTGGQETHIVSHADFTPGRQYFEAKVIAYTDTTVLINYNQTAAPEGKTRLQLLDAETGAVKWTNSIEKESYKFGSDSYPLAIAGGRFLYAEYDHVNLIENDGSIRECLKFSKQY